VSVVAVAKRGALAAIAADSAAVVRDENGERTGESIPGDIDARKVFTSSRHSFAVGAFGVCYFSGYRLADFFGQCLAQLDAEDTAGFDVVGAARRVVTAMARTFGPLWKGTPTGSAGFFVGHDGNGTARMVEYYVTGRRSGIRERLRDTSGVYVNTGAGAGALGVLASLGPLEHDKNASGVAVRLPTFAPIVVAERIVGAAIVDAGRNPRPSFTASGPACVFALEPGHPPRPA
jgi:hypothetical protein